MFGLGFFLASMTTSLPWLYIGFGAMIGAGNGFGYAITIPVISKWFPDKRGLALGIVIGGYGIASGVWGPIAARLIEGIGWQATFRLYGFLFLAITMIGSWLLRNPPEGYHPPGWDAAAQAKTSGAPLGGRHSHFRDAKEAHVLFSLDALHAGLRCRSHADQPARSLR